MCKQDEFWSDVGIRSPSVDSVYIWNSLWGTIRPWEIRSHLPEQRALRSKGEDCVQFFQEREHKSPEKEEQQQHSWASNARTDSQMGSPFLICYIVTHWEIFEQLTPGKQQQNWITQEEKAAPAFSLCFVGHLIAHGRSSLLGLKHPRYFCSFEAHWYNTEPLNSEGVRNYKS